MTVSTRMAFPRHDVITYTGTGMADIVSYINDRFIVGYPDNYLEFVSEIDGVGVVNENVLDGNTYTINTGSIIVLNYYIMEIFTPVEFAKKFEFLVEAVTGVAATSLETFEASNLHQSIGSDSVPLLIATASTTIQVTLSPSFSSTDYSVAATLVGSAALLTALTITNVTKVSGSRVDVTVQNNGLISISGGFVVVAAVSYE